jgi:hypothetical protein
MPQVRARTEHQCRGVSMRCAPRVSAGGRLVRGCPPAAPAIRALNEPLFPVRPEECVRNIGRQGATMKIPFALSIWRRADDFVVAPENGGGGLWFAVEPVERVGLAFDELVPAIERAIAASDVSLRAVDLRRYESPIPNAVGLRSNRAFEQSILALCSVRRSGGDISSSRGNAALATDADSSRWIEPSSSQRTRPRRRSRKRRYGSRRMRPSAEAAVAAVGRCPRGAPGSGLDSCTES